MIPSDCEGAWGPLVALCPSKPWPGLLVERKLQGKGLSEAEQVVGGRPQRNCMRTSHSLAVALLGKAAGTGLLPPRCPGAAGNDSAAGCVQHPSKPPCLSCWLDPLHPRGLLQLLLFYAYPSLSWHLSLHAQARFKAYQEVCHPSICCFSKHPRNH